HLQAITSLVKSPPFPYTTLFRSPTPTACNPSSPTSCTTPASPPATRSPPPSSSRPYPTSTRPPSASRKPSRPSRSSSCTATTTRSEEHTSELQSRENLVCRLLLE